MLRLKPGATLEAYDPWDVWRDSVDEERPYKSLLRLVQRLDIKEPRFAPQLLGKQKQLLEQWVRRNGLLGILPHETLEVTLAPRWVEERSIGAHSYSVGDPAGVRVLVAAQRHYERDPGGWRSRYLRPAYAREFDPALEGQLVSEERLGAPWFAVETLCRRLPASRLERQPLHEHWHHFFPDVAREEAESYPYPSLGSEAFWSSYGEPLMSFVRAAQSLADVLQAFEVVRRSERDKDGDLAEDEAQIAWRAMRRLNDYLVGVTPAAGLRSNGSVAAQWSTPSLLGSYAVMLLSDLAAGQLVRSCPNCGVFFLSKNPRTSYCSSSCRYAYQKRHWRQAQGRSAEEPTNS